MEVNYEEVIAGKEEKIGGSKESIGVLSPFSLLLRLLLFNFIPLAFLSAPFKAATKEEGKGLARMSRASRERERERGERSEGLASIVRSRLSFNFCVTLLWVELSRSLLCEGFCCSLFRILANRQSFFPSFSSVISILYRYCFLFFVSFLF